MKSGLDYVFVSYYDWDNDGQHEDWNTMFSNLYNIFPNAKLGFGECGVAAPQEEGSEFNEQVDKYYKMIRYNSRYVGGYFWWNWIEDCVPYDNNSKWDQINDAFFWMSNNLDA